MPLDITKVYLAPNDNRPTQQNSIIRQVLEYVSTQNKQRAVTSTSTIADNDAVITFSVTSPTSYSLPPASGRSLPLIFKDLGGYAAAANISLVPNGSDLIDGSTGYTLVSNYASVTLNPINGGSTTTGWFIT